MSAENPYFSFTLDIQGVQSVFTCYDNELSKQVCRDILQGRTYPFFPFVVGVRTIVDIGANVGAAAVHFHNLYPGAVVHAFEPHRETYFLLQRNTFAHDTIVPHNFGLFDVDKSMKLFKGTDSVNNSIHSQVAGSTGDHEMVRLRAASAVMQQLGVAQIDILKLDTEGCETPILMSIYRLAAEAKIIYLEYHADADRLFIDALLSKTHYLCFARADFPNRGELAYINRNIPFDIEMMKKHFTS